MDRRMFLKGSVAGMAMFGVPYRQAAALEELLGASLARMPVRKSLDIKASSLSVGVEVLDRRGFEPEKTYPYLEKLGVKWARCQTGWGRCETRRGRYNFSWLDELVDALLNIGIQPWFNVGYGNRLYTLGAVDEAAVGFTPIYDEAAMMAWLKYVEALVKHFSGRVSHYEVWNEPNHPGFWRPRDPNEVDYVRLLARTALVIRAADPSAKVIGGAFAGIPVDYISRCFREGMQEHIDILSFHPYRACPERKYADEIQRLRKVLSVNDADCLLWQGENGCPSVGGAGSTGALSDLPWDETLQAKWLLRRILTDLKAGLALTSYFHIVDLVGYRGETNYKGLLRGTDYTPKPAYFAYQYLCALFDSDTKLLDRQQILTCQPTKGVSADSKDAIQHACFSRNGKLLCASWYAADLLEPSHDGHLSIRMKKTMDVSLADPVLLDPLSGDIYKFEDIQVKESVIEIRNMPLRNYPLLLADRAVLKR